MTKSTIQPLESYRLAQYAVPIPCYICGADNTYDAEFCTHCQAPMALAHQANSQKIRPHMMAAVGTSAVGKTVYLGMLIDMLSRQSKGSQLLARGAFSITLQQTGRAALARCEFPDKTPSEPDRWNWVHCQIHRQIPRQRRRHPMELIMPDMAGDAVLDEIDHPHTYRLIRAFLTKCSGAMVFVDAVELQRGDRDQDYFAMKLLSYLAELDGVTASGWCKRPVALIFTKTDQCDECRFDPAAFAKAHASGLWQQCRERFRSHRFFATAVAGACVSCESRLDGRRYLPPRIEPHGIVEPFEWLLGQIKE